MNLPVFIARKYFLSKQNTNAINILSFISMVVVSVVTMALIVVLSVYNGFESLIHSLYGSFYPDMHISVVEGKTFVPEKNKVDKILELKEVIHLSEVIEEKALLKYQDKQYIATIKGVDSNYRYVAGIDENIIRGEYKLIDKGQSMAIAGAGIEIALGLYLNSLFDFITVYMPKRGKGTGYLLEQAFNRNTINPIGIFSIQIDFDSEYMIVPISFARGLLRYKDEVSALELKLQSGININETQKKIQQILGDKYSVKNRYQQNEFLYKLMKTERWAVYLILSLILFIAAFNIIGSLSMLVIEKTRDIAILKSMGANSKLIQKIFLIEGMLVSVIGASIGAVFAIILCFLQEQFGLVRIEGNGTFVVDAYPVEMHAGDFIIVLMTVLVISLLACWYPAKKASEKKTIWKEE